MMLPESFEAIERLMRDSLKQIEGVLSESDRSDVAEYIDFGEYGVAYDLLIFILNKHKITHPDGLKSAEKIMTDKYQK